MTGPEVSTLWWAHLLPLTFYLHDLVSVPVEVSLRSQAQLLPRCLPELHRPNDAYEPTLGVRAAAPLQA